MAKKKEFKVLVYMGSDEQMKELANNFYRKLIRSYLEIVNIKDITDESGVNNDVK